MSVKLANELRALAGLPPVPVVRQARKVAPLPVIRDEAAQAACRAICDECEHATEVEYGRPACDRIRCCAGSRAASAARYKRAIESGKCPLGKW